MSDKESLEHLPKWMRYVLERWKALEADRQRIASQQEEGD
jgi:hypothetical protein